MMLTMKIKKLVTFYWSPIQIDELFDEFLFNFKSSLGYTDAPSSSQWKNDINNNEGINIENLTSSYGLKQHML